MMKLACDRNIARAVTQNTKSNPLLRPDQMCFSRLEWQSLGTNGGPCWLNWAIAALFQTLEVATCCASTTRRNVAKNWLNGYRWRGPLPACLVSIGRLQ